MMGRREKKQQRTLMMTIEEIMPEKHLLRDVDRLVDFSFIYDRMKPMYSGTGRPSIDPVMIIKALLLGYLYGIPSERRLEEEIKVNIAYHWFLGLDLGERVPDHSTYSQLRRRKYGDGKIFQEIFDEIVLRCIEVGLVSGKTLVMDSTHVRANVNDNIRETISVKVPPSEYMRQLDEMMGVEAKPSKDREIQVSPADSDARIYNRNKKPQGFYYIDHQTSDADSGIVTDVYVTPGNASDNEPVMKRMKRQIDTFGIKPEEFGGDKGYDYGEIHAGMLELGIKTYIPFKDENMPQQNQVFCLDKFIYNETKDIYVCPAGHELTNSGYRNGVGRIKYQSKLRICNMCLLRSECLSGKNTRRRIERPIHKAQAELQRKNIGTVEYKRVQQRRRIVCEGNFSIQKSCHRLQRAWGRGLIRLREQCLLSAIALNLRRLINWLNHLPTEHF